jgi:glycosyltransferase involved in cell wall biosynthesis
MLSSLRGMLPVAGELSISTTHIMTALKSSGVARRTEIVVPTLAEAHRAEQLVRAIDSIQSQGATALVVVNGHRFNSSVIAHLERLEGIRLLCIPEPGLPNAIHVGRRAVEGEYFGFLDDDDYLMPGAIATREAFMDTHPEKDAVVTNGLREEWGNDPQLFKSRADLDRITEDPFAALLSANWLTPCGALYRSGTVEPDTFLGLAKYAEWTDVAFRLIKNYRFGFLFENTFVQSDTPGSLSKHNNQERSVLALHKKMAGSVKTPVQRRRLALRICNFHHQIAVAELSANNFGEALQHHLRSLFHAPSVGIRYLAYTRKFFLPRTMHRSGDD